MVWLDGPSRFCLIVYKWSGYNYQNLLFSTVAVTTLNKADFLLVLQLLPTAATSVQLARHICHFSSMVFNIGSMWVVPMSAMTVLPAPLPHS